MPAAPPGPQCSLRSLSLFLSVILTFLPSPSLPLSSSANSSCLAGSVLSGVFHRALFLFLFSSLILLFSVSIPLSLFALISSHFQLPDNFLYRLVMEALRELSKKKKSDKSIARPYKSYSRHFLFRYIPPRASIPLSNFCPCTCLSPQCPASLTGEAGGERSWSRPDTAGRET